MKKECKTCAHKDKDYYDIPGDNPCEDCDEYLNNYQLSFDEYIRRINEGLEREMKENRKRRKRRKCSGGRMCYCAPFEEKYD